MHTLSSLVIFGCSIFVASALYAPGNYQGKTGSESAGSLGSKIIGGELAAIEKYPFAVSLQNNGTFFGHEVEHFCGGGIVGKKWIITSAQCALRIHVKSFHVRAGTACYHAGGVIYGVKGVVIHPAFNQNNYDYDVAIVELDVPESSPTKVDEIFAELFNLLGTTRHYSGFRGYHLLERRVTIVFLSESIVFDETKQPIQLPKLHSEIQDGAQVQVLGWGASVLLGPVSDELLCSTMQKINNEDCRQANGADLLTHRMFCTLSDHASACVGDSGSPLIFNGIFFGVASWSQSCQLEYPTAYTAISEVRDWIVEVIEHSE